MVKVDLGAIGRIRRHHPMQYGYRSDDERTPIYDPGDDATVIERYNRCPTCEQWSPCDVRELLENVLKEQDNG